MKTPNIKRAWRALRGTEDAPVIKYRTVTVLGKASITPLYRVNKTPREWINPEYDYFLSCKEAFAVSEYASKVGALKVDGRYYVCGDLKEVTLATNGKDES